MVSVDTVTGITQPRSLPRVGFGQLHSTDSDITSRQPDPFPDSVAVGGLVPSPGIRPLRQWLTVNWCVCGPKFCALGDRPASFHEAPSATHYTRPASRQLLPGNSAQRIHILRHLFGEPLSASLAGNSALRIYTATATSLAWARDYLPATISCVGKQTAVTGSCFATS